MSDLNDVFPPMLENFRLMQDKIRRLEYENSELKASVKEIVNLAVEAETKKRLLEWSALLAENTRLYEALEPFEKEADMCGYYDMSDCEKWHVPVAIIRAAAAALKETGDE